MASRFPELVAMVLKHEGGYVADPQDPGGETNFGISKRAFPREDIKRLTREKAIAIYQKNYWDAARCSEVPEILQPIYFDTAVNCGVVTAIRLLQLCAGVPPSGVFGNVTKQQVALVTVRAYADQRIAYNERIIARNPALKKFRKGWTRRINSFLA